LVRAVGLVGRGPLIGPDPRFLRGRNGLLVNGVVDVPARDRGVGRHAGDLHARNAGRVGQLPHLPDGAVLAVEHLVALRPQVADGVVPELPQAVGHLRDARRPGRAGTRRDAGVLARTALARTTGREAVEGESGVLGDSASLDDVVRTRGPLVRGGGLVERREGDPSRDREAGDDDHAQESGDERMPPTIRGAIRPVLDRCGFHCALLASARPFPVGMTVAPRKWRSGRIAGFPGVSRNRLPERRPFYRRAAFPSENFRFTGLELYTRTADRTPSRGPRRPPAHAVRALRSVGE